ncbi:hypothetical protein [Bifidobacterium asteroides]|uniref:Uncharacterized protein n=1 Tax=Bifidobacterium asteroides TaxID=1684 RepID=A0A318M4S7_9BIFI|nr:hypothetical protein [Bifidobacterium asteroides]PXY81423.1 hypothetical protein DKK75_06655 [Bifidobacterium asteroides]
MTMITIAEYAAMHGRAEVSVRQMASRGGLRTARKKGRNWMVDSEEPYPDRRRRMSVAPTREGMDAQQRRHKLKIAQAQQYSRAGELDGAFAANSNRIPAELADQLTPEQLGWIMDLLADAYTDGQRHPD